MGERIRLSFFRGDVFSILLEPWFLRNAAAQLWDD